MASESLLVFVLMIQLFSFILLFVLLAECKVNAAKLDKLMGQPLVETKLET